MSVQTFIQATIVKNILVWTKVVVQQIDQQLELQENEFLIISKTETLKSSIDDLYFLWHCLPNYESNNLREAGKTSLTCFVAGITHKGPVSNLCVSQTSSLHLSQALYLDIYHGNSISLL